MLEREGLFLRDRSPLLIERQEDRVLRDGLVRQCGLAAIYLQSYAAACLEAWKSRSAPGLPEGRSDDTSAQYIVRLERANKHTRIADEQETYPIFLHPA